MLGAFLTISYYLFSSNSISTLNSILTFLIYMLIASFNCLIVMNVQVLGIIVVMHVMVVMFGFNRFYYYK